jgi:acyl-CoA thioesterase
MSAVDGAVTRMLAADAASRALGMSLVESGPGYATVRMTVRPDMLNGHAIAHGGFIFALADTAFACACNSHGPTTVAAGADIAFLRSAHAGDELEARAVERVRHGRSGIYDVTVWRGGDVVAEFRGRSRTIGTEHTG